MYLSRKGRESVAMWLGDNIKTYLNGKGCESVAI